MDSNWPVSGKTHQERTSMKNLVTMLLALGLAVSFAAPTFAADAPKDKASCEKANMTWDEATKTCTKKQ